MKQLIFGVLFIVLGASGEFVLRGTNSSGLLIIAGIVFTIIGIVRLASGSTKETEEVPQVSTEKQKMYSICKTCANKKFDIKTGINCGLTDSKPNFTEMCPNYSNN